MRKINLSISGCMGRMGQQLIKSSKKDKNFKLVSLTENRIINKRIAGLKPSKNSVEAFKKSSVISPVNPKCPFFHTNQRKNTKSYLKLLLYSCLVFFLFYFCLNKSFL